MFSWICSKCGNMQDIFKVCKCGNTSNDKSSVFIYADEGIESLNLPIGSHTEVTIDGKSFEVKVYKDTYKEPQRNEDFRVTNKDVAYGLSEALTGMALDYASLYNVSDEVEE